jgi:hypothetical protein
MKTRILSTLAIGTALATSLTTASAQFSPFPSPNQKLLQIYSSSDLEIACNRRTLSVLEGVKIGLDRLASELTERLQTATQLETKGEIEAELGRLALVQLRIEREIESTRDEIRVLEQIRKSNPSTPRPPSPRTVVQNKVPGWSSVVPMADRRGERRF